MNSHNPTDQATIDRLKAEAANRAAEVLKDGMIVGLGSGTTAKLAVDAIGRRVAQGLKITGIPTSEQTAAQAEELHIPLATLGDYPVVDLTIDGADEVEQGTLFLIKGGGGNQLREKIVAYASKQLFIVVDERKLVDKLGSQAKVPVEVAQFGWQATSRALEQLGSEPQLRSSKTDLSKPFITDGGNFILDCSFGPISDAQALQTKLDAIVGVVEHGLFLNMTSRVFIGTDSGIRELSPSH